MSTASIVFRRVQEVRSLRAVMHDCALANRTSFAAVDDDTPVSIFVQRSVTMLTTTA